MFSNITPALFCDSERLMSGISIDIDSGRVGDGGFSGILE